MKCSVCAAEIPDGSAWCAACGQPTSYTTEFASVQTRWDAVAEDIRQYETKRSEEEARIRRSMRPGFVKWIILAAVLALVVGWLTMVDGGKQFAGNARIYLNGWWAMHQGEYTLAIEYFDDMDAGFLNSRSLSDRCRWQIQYERYEKAMDVYYSGDYARAMELFEELGDFDGARDAAQMCRDAIWGGMALPTLHWPFAEGLTEAGGLPTTVYDNTNWAQVPNSRITHAAAFDGSWDFIHPETNASVTENWTMTVLFSCRSGDTMPIVTKYDPRGGYMTFRLYTREGAIIWEFVTADGQSVTLESSTVMEYGTQWYHTGIVKEGSSIRLYVNGIKEAEATLPGEIAADGEYNWRFGTQKSLRDGEGLLEWFDGYIADVAVYESSFTDLEMTLLYEPFAYDATHLWDTDYGMAMDGVENYDHFLCFRSDAYEGLTCLALINVSDPRTEYVLHRDQTGHVQLSDGEALLRYDLYLWDGEQWFYETTYDCSGDGIYNVTEVISSDLHLYDVEDTERPALKIGGIG